MPSPYLSAAETILDFKTKASRDIDAASIKSIIDPRFADHVRREAFKFVDEFKRVVYITASACAKKLRVGRNQIMNIQFSIIRSLAIAMTLAGLIVAASTKAAAQTPEKSLYDRLGGVFAISAVVDHFSDAVVKNPIVGKDSKNPALRNWHRNSLDRLPGLKFMRTLWVCDITGGPYKFSPTKPGSTPLGLENAHHTLKISPAEFDEVAAELGRTLDWAKVPAREKGEVLAAFAAHKGEVTAGFKAK